MNTDRIEKQILLQAPLTRIWRALSDSAEFKLGGGFGGVAGGDDEGFACEDAVLEGIEGPIPQPLASRGSPRQPRGGRGTGRPIR